jgi:hypothetical protein
VRLILELEQMISGRTVGTLFTAEGAELPFDGWMDLMRLLEGLSEAGATRAASPQAEMGIVT